MFITIISVSINSETLPQILINRTLREVIISGQTRSMQTDLLNDQQFLAELKTKLETV